MHRFKRLKNSPRTLYNGPFVLPKQALHQGLNPTPSPGYANTLACISPAVAGHAPEGHAHSPGGAWSPALSWTQPAAHVFLQRTRSLAACTPRSDEGCRPVYNFSFLEDSGAGSALGCEQQQQQNLSADIGKFGSCPRRGVHPVASPRISPSSGLGVSIDSLCCVCRPPQQFSSRQHHHQPDASPIHHFSGGFPSAPLYAGPTVEMGQRLPAFSSPEWGYRPPVLHITNSSASSMASSPQGVNFHQNTGPRPMFPSESADTSSSRQRCDLPDIAYLPQSGVSLPYQSQPQTYQNSCCTQNIHPFSAADSQHSRALDSRFANGFDDHGVTRRGDRGYGHTTVPARNTRSSSFTQNVHIAPGKALPLMPTQSMVQPYNYNFQQILEQQHRNAHHPPLTRAAGVSVNRSHLHEWGGKNNGFLRNFETNPRTGEECSCKRAGPDWTCSPEHQRRMLQGFPPGVCAPVQNGAHGVQVSNTHFTNTPLAQRRSDQPGTPVPSSRTILHSDPNSWPTPGHPHGHSHGYGPATASTGVQFNQAWSRTPQRPPHGSRLVHPHPDGSLPVMKRGPATTQRHTQGSEHVFSGRLRNVEDSPQITPGRESPTDQQLADPVRSFPQRPGNNNTIRTRGGDVSATEFPDSQGKSGWSGAEREVQKAKPRPGRGQYNHYGRWFAFPRSAKISSPSTFGEEAERGRDGRGGWPHHFRYQPLRRHWPIGQSSRYTRNSGGNFSSGIPTETSTTTTTTTTTTTRPQQIKVNSTRGRQRRREQKDHYQKHAGWLEPRSVTVSEVDGEEGHGGDLPSSKVVFYQKQGQQGQHHRFRRPEHQNRTLETNSMEKAQNFLPRHSLTRGCRDFDKDNSHSNQIRCELKEHGADDNRHDVTSAALFTNDKCVARSNGKSRKEAKDKVYDEARSGLLRSRSAQEAILNDDTKPRVVCKESLNVGIGNKGENCFRADCAVGHKNQTTRTESAIRLRSEATVNQNAATKSKERKAMDPITRCHLERLIRDLKFPRGSKVESGRSKVNQIWAVDKHCVKSKLKLLIIYKGVHHPNENVTITCDLYLCERFLAQGNGHNRKLAQAHAYRRACDVLRNMASSEDLLDQRELDRREFKQPDVIDIVHKGYQVVEESNVCRLNRIKQPPAEQQTRENLIILEHEDWSRDRRKHAHCILSQSATQSGCLLEWRTEPCARGFRCSMTLQGELIASCVTRQRKDAVRVTSIMALFTFYETQPIVRGFHVDYPSVWTTRERLMQIANTLRTTGTAVTHAKVSRATEAQSLPCQADGKSPIDENIAAAIEVLVKDYGKQETLEQLVCAPDWRMEEKRHLRSYAAGSGLRVVTENFREDQVLVVSHKHSLFEVYQILQKQPNKAQGRYKILRDEAKPCYMDVAAEIAGDESLVEQGTPPVCTLNPSDNDNPSYCKKPGKGLEGGRCQKPFEYKRTSPEKNTRKESSRKVSSGEDGKFDIRSPRPGIDMVESNSAETAVTSIGVGVNHAYVSSEETPSAETRDIGTQSSNEQNSEGRTDNCPECGSSDNSDIFVSANNTLSNVPSLTSTEPAPPESPGTSHNPGPPQRDVASPGGELPRPRITSTPSSHQAGGSKTWSRLDSVSTGVNRALPFSETETPNDFDSSGESSSSSLPARRDLESDCPMKLSSSLSSESLQVSRSSSPSPSDPCSARLGDHLSSYDENQQISEIVTNGQSHYKGCQDVHAEEESHKHQGFHREFDHVTHLHPIRRMVMPRPNKDGSIDVEACLGSPEQRAVCIIQEQSSQCVRFKSEFATCNETEFATSSL